MNTSLARLLDGPWTVPALGLAAAGVAFAVGWRFLAPRPAEPPPRPTNPDEALCGVNRDRRAAPRRKGNSVEVELVPPRGGGPRTPAGR